MSFKPMLAEHVDLTKLTYPKYVSPKLDGVRAIVKDGIVYSRKLKPIPNEYVQELFGRDRYNGLDGELIVGSPTHPKCFSNTTSGVMSKEGEPEVSFYIFDYIDQTRPFRYRFEDLLKFQQDDNIVIVPQSEVVNEEELLLWENKYLTQGYEGLMLRDMDSPYKFGRSTVREQYLLKMKRYQDSEAIVLSMLPLLHNTNEATVNEIGKKHRSNHKAGMVEEDTLGTLVVRDIKTQQEFNIGTGFSDDERKYYWYHKEELLGKQIKYKYFGYGNVEKPRHPTFIGIRDEKD